ncbi:MAG: RNA-binding protein [Pseudomonadales bacterium]|nr:RNA-binding protein [Pseudomonadales bacterium]MCP5184137.1 RNA-binding protein [Pseudomonadales bacterium]
MTERVRLDQWLWAARLYRTRALAKQAVDGGKVHMAGQRAKCSRAMKVGDELHISRPWFDLTVTVTGLSARRGDAESARLLYTESEASVREREQILAQRRLARAGLTAPRLRPDKHDRRDLVELKRQDDA